MMSASGRFCYKTILRTPTRKIDSRSRSKAQHRFKSACSRIRLFQIQIPQTSVGDICNKIGPYRPFAAAQRYVRNRWQSRPAEDVAQTALMTRSRQTGEAIAAPAFLQDSANLLVQFLAQFSIELVSIDRPVKRNWSAFSLNIRKNKCHPWTRVFRRGAVARLRNDFPRGDQG